MRIFILAISAILAVTPALAHDPRKGPNGGTIVDAGSYHVELVTKSSTVEVFVTDGADKPVISEGLQAVAILITGGKALRIQLKPAGENRLSGQSPVDIPPNPKGAVQLTGPDGTTASARFN